VIAARLARLLGAPPRHVRDLGTSHDWTLHQAVLADGRPVFVKAAAAGGESRDAGEGLLTAEAKGLDWLGTPGVAAVPEVVAADDATLVLPWLEPSGATPRAAERLGRELAALHAAGAEAFGALWPGFIARLPLDNSQESSWPEWYARRRLLPYVRMAAEQGELSGADVRVLERAAEAVATGDGVGGPPEPPARVHGDLWSGNVLWSDGRGWLIDPAAHGGHRETDLAMLALFGAPHLDRIRAAYTEASPLADGWRRRIPLHQLHPLLVHVVLFGGGYRTAALEAAHAVLRLG
jgi:fructosamine-3-kinase